MTDLTEFKKSELSDADLTKISGGGFTQWEKVRTDDKTGLTLEQKYTWWGLHGTTETRTDNCG